jgi:nitrogen fixation NifU-like protein
LVVSDLAELYQAVILDHNERPRNFGPLPDATHHAEGHNPLCGDQISVALRVEGDRIGAIGFEGQGCAISKASASLMTEKVRGLSLTDTERLFSAFHALVTVGSDSDLGKLAVFSGVREFPMRVKCATLCWHTLRGALAQHAEMVTTE